MELAPVIGTILGSLANLLDFVKFSRDEFIATTLLRNNLCREIRFQISGDIVRQLPAVNSLTAQLSQAEFSAQCGEVFTTYLGTQSKPLQDHLRAQRLYDSYAYSFRLSKYGTIAISIISIITVFKYVELTDPCTQRLLWWAVALLLIIGLSLYIFRQLQRDRLLDLATEYEIPNGK